MSSTGYYKLAVAGGQYTTFTYWWQARRSNAALRRQHVLRLRWTPLWARLLGAES